MKKIMVVLLLASLGLVGCRTFPPVHNIEHQAVAVNDQQKVEQTIIAGGMRARGWQISKVKDGLLLGTFTIRSHQFTVDIPYTANEYSIIYKDSENLRYDAKKNTIHPRYNRTVANLSRTINKLFLRQP